MSPDDRWRILHMIDAAALAQSFVVGRQRTDLDLDAMLTMALTRAIEIIGEAAAQVSTEGRAELPQLPWAAIVGMRNRLVHAYFDVDRDVLWDTTLLALPVLLDQLGTWGRE
jgi:uncharacterized protein with HEPN domain